MSEKLRKRAKFGIRCAVCEMRPIVGLDECGRILWKRCGCQRNPGHWMKRNGQRIYIDSDPSPRQIANRAAEIRRQNEAAERGGGNASHEPRPGIRTINTRVHPARYHD